MLILDQAARMSRVVGLNCVVSGWRWLCFSRLGMRMLRVQVVLGLVLMAGGCSNSNSIKQSRPKVPPRLLDRGQDMSILRTDFRRAASIRFFTIYPAYCRVQYWSISLGDNPPDAQRSQAACFRATTSESHFVRLENLNPRDPQYIRLLVSSRDPLVSKADDRVILKETSDTFSYFPPEQSKIPLEEAMAVTVVKANLTQASAGIYSNFLSHEDLAEQKKQFVKKTKGCKPYPPPPYGALLPPRDIGLSEISTSGYYSTSGIELDKNRSVYLLDFTGKHEPAIQWLFRLKIKGQDFHYQVHSPPEFRSVKLTQPQEITLLRHDLIHATAGTTLARDSGGELVFTWRSRNVLDGDFVEILIGKPSLGHAIRCQFSAKLKTATLTWDDLERVRGVMKDVVVSLNRKLVSVEQNSHLVFLHTHDWRHSRLKLP